MVSNSANFRLERWVGESLAMSMQFSDRSLLMLGRDSAAADVVIPEPMVSRMHVTIRIADNAMWLEDAGSMNGTYGADRHRLLPGVEVVHPIGVDFYLAHAGVALRVTFAV